MDVLTNACFLSLFVGQVLAYSQLVNINTTAVSSTQYGDYVASRVVDGNIDQYHTNCSHTSSRKTIQFAWLYVDLGKVFSVHSVKLWYRNDKRSPNARAKRLRGYHIRVSKNKKVPLESESCYQDSGTGFPLTILEQECKGEARYIWFYQSTKLPEDPCPMLEICEVQVLGCETGTYGESCLKKCYHCKNNATCGIQNGECDGSGCIGLYKPPLCKECIKGMYGNNCEKNCNPLCKIGECNRITGVCLDGCMTGYKGNFCNHTCKTRSYGMNCKEACGHCYRNTTCRHDNGTCQQGCAAGYKSHDCKTPCTDGEYGMNCNFNCSRHCLYGEVCNRIDGSCRSCEDGYEGFKCNTKCEAGKYGKACSESCGACLNSTVCNHITGDCELGCEPGWQNTAQCKTACNATWFGDGCKSQCGYCLGENNCHHVNGSCLLGCQEGFTGELCFNRTLQMDVSFPGTLDLTVLLLIVCPVAGLLFIALCVVTVVFLLRDGRHRKRKQKNETTNEKFQEIEDQDNEDEESPETLDDTNLYTTVQIRSKSIKTTDLPSVIKSMGSDTDKGFTEEFNSIPYGEQSDILCTVGKLPENIPKNRFKTTFPYDHSRVVLQSSKNRDYINANFIKNTYGDAVYIASQGPKPKTVGDFWQMVWQENVLVIVMVTNLKEGDKVCYES